MQNISISQEEKIKALRLNSYFAGLDGEVLFELSEGTYLRHFEPAEIICWYGEPCTGLYMIRRGSVKLFKLSNKGRELIIRVLEEGATFNEVPVFDDGPNVVNVAALDESEIWIFEKDAIRNTLREHPEMAQAVILNLTQNLRNLVSMIEELSFYQVTNRLARLIGQLPEIQLSGPKDQRLTQDIIAARLGTVREVVARSLRELDHSGAIAVQRGRIKVIDRKVLDEWAQAPAQE